MAKSKKGASDKTQEPETVDDIIDEVTEEPQTDASALEPIATEEEPAPEENDEGADLEAADQPVSDEAEVLENDTAPDVVRETVVERKGGFVPMLLGGVLAAGVGVVASDYIFPDGLPFGPQATQTVDLKSELALQSGRIDDLTAKLEAQPLVDTAALDAAVAAVGDLQAQIGSVLDTVGGLETRLDALEARPAGDGSGVSVKIEREIEELRAALDVQKGELAKMLDAAEAKQQSAEETARQTMARAAVTRILVALDSGAPFADALAEVEANTDVDVAEALKQTADEGVPTLSALSEAFPDAARNALAAARSEDDSSGVGGFLAKQLGVRSVAPREGDDPDAVLSRTQAAVAEGRIADALAEADALPEPAKAALADWMAQANLRLSAAQEAEALANSLNSQ